MYAWVWISFCQVLDVTWAKLLNFFRLMFIYVQNGIKMKSRDFSGWLSDEDSTLYKKKKKKTPRTQCRGLRFISLVKELDPKCCN